MRLSLQEILVSVTVLFVQALMGAPAWGQTELVCTPITDAQNTSADPVSPATCQPYTGGFNNPAVFFTPHPDDETLAMAGHIKQALAADRTVVVELMTRGTASNAFSIVNGENDSNFLYDHGQGCSGADYTHYGTGAYPLTDTEAMGKARVREFLDSMRRLGVQAVVIHDYQDGALSSQKVTDRITQYWLTRGIPGMGFYGTAGSEDAANHPDHVAVHDGVVNSGATPRTLLSPYAGTICDVTQRHSYAQQNWARMVPLDSATCDAKKNALLSYQVWNPSAGRYALGWVHSASAIFVALSATGASEDCNEYVTQEAGTQSGSNGNPLSYANARDQFLACYGISQAPNYPSNCRDISDFNDKQMCYGLSQYSQDPCRSMTDRNLQLACYGMAFAPNYPSNCRDVTDPQMQAFCYGVSSGGSYPAPNCSSVTDAPTRALCLGMSLHNASYCSSIGNTNDRLFCSAVSSHNPSSCATISSCPDPNAQAACNSGGGTWDWNSCSCSYPGCDPSQESACTSQGGSWDPASCSCNSNPCGQEIICQLEQVSWKPKFKSGFRELHLRAINACGGS
jgi:LmbE family N-acetylglucosaminyl deacetylase